MNLGDAVLKLTTDNTDLAKGLDKAHKDSVAKGKEIGAAFTAAFSAALGFSAVLVKAWGEQEDAAAHLAAAFKAQGHEASMAVSAISDLAGALQLTTRFGDEATLAAAAMLEQLTGLDTEAVMTAIPAMQNLAAGMGIDLSAAASLMAKAIEGNVGALGRYGIKIDATLPPSERFEAIMKALNDRFRGMADALGQTTLGRLDVLKAQLGELAEVGGRALSVFFKPLADLLTPVIKALADFGAETFKFTDAINAVNKGTATSAQAIYYWTEVSKEAKKKMTDLTAAHQAGTREFRIQSDIYNFAMNNLKGYNQLIAEQAQKAKAAKDAAALLAQQVITLTDDTDKMTSRWVAMGEAFETVKGNFDGAVEDMTSRWVAMGESIKVVTQKMIDFIGLRIMAEANLTDQIAKNAKDQKDIKDKALAEEKARLDLYTSWTATAYTDIFSFMADSLWQGSLNWKTFGTEVVHSIGKIVRAMGDQLAADAAVDTIKGLAALASIIGAPAAPGLFASAAIKAAGSLASYVAAIGLETFSFAHGADFTVPPGYPNDSFPMRVESGEHVSVTPAGEGGGDMMHNTLVLDGSVIGDWITKASRNKRFLITARSVVP